ncbi:MAG: gamma carbonic anhydrase family protein [Tagaea sp.]|nr:gamma carbonic anhydrase family protein [Magnetospirillum sp.]
MTIAYRDWAPKVDATAFVADTARVIGNVEIGARATIWYGVVVRGDVHEIRIGADTNVQDGAVIHCSYEKFGTYIGARVTVGHLALLHGCTVEDDAFIGMKACVMDGAVVEKGGWVAAGALVTPGKRVKSGELWAGSPAKFFRAVTADEREGAETAMRRYVGLGREYKAQ